MSFPFQSSAKELKQKDIAYLENRLKELENELKEAYRNKESLQRTVIFFEAQVRQLEHKILEMIGCCNQMANSFNLIYSMSKMHGFDHPETQKEISKFWEADKKHQSFGKPGKDTISLEARLNKLEKENEELKAQAENWKKVEQATPVPPNAITFEQGWHILDLVQKAIKNK